MFFYSLTQRSVFTLQAMQKSCPYYVYVKHYICEVDSIRNYQNSCQEVLNAADLYTTMYLHMAIILAYDIPWKQVLGCLIFRFNQFSWNIWTVRFNNTIVSKGPIISVMILTTRYHVYTYVMLCNCSWTDMPRIMSHALSLPSFSWTSDSLTNWRQDETKTFQNDVESWIDGCG